MSASNRAVGRVQGDITISPQWLLIAVLSTLLVIGLFGFPAVDVASANTTTTESGTADGEAGVDAEFDDDEIEVGTEDTVEVEVSNDDGEIGLTFGNDPPQEVEARLLRAEGTEVELTDAPDGVDIRTDSQRIGTLEDGESETVPFEIYVDEDEFDPGEEFDLDIEVSYTDIERVEYTLNADGDVIGISNEAESDETDTFTDTVSIEDEVRFDVIDTESDVQVDDSGEWTVVMNNTGSENATDVVVTAESGDSEVFFGSDSPTASRTVGEWAAGETKELTFRAGTTDEALIEPYPIGVTVEYDDEDGDRQTEDDADTGQATLEPTDRQQYTVDDVSHEVQIGDDGLVAVNVTNHGPQSVTDAVVELSAGDGDIAFGSAGEESGAPPGEEFGLDVDGLDDDGGPGSPTASAYVGEWEADETVTLVYQTAVADDAVEREYPLEATITALDRNDNELEDRDREFGFEPLPEQTFDIQNADTSLRVGEDGDVVGSVTNDGEYTAENVVVQLASEPSNVLPRNNEYAIGDLEPGETAEFDFRLGITEEAEAGPQMLEFETRYRSDGDIRVDSSQDIMVDVEPDRDSFDVDVVNATFEPGESDIIEVELENNRDETVTDVRAKVFPDTPIASDDDESFVTEIEPGETETVIFDVGVDSGVSPQDYPLSLDIRYDDERGDSQLSGTYQLPITVTESTDDGLPVWLISGGVLVAIGGALVVFRGRITDEASTLRGRLDGN